MEAATNSSMSMSAVRSPRNSWLGFPVSAALVRRNNYHGAAPIDVAQWQLDKYYVLRYHSDHSTITTVTVPGQSQARNLYFDATLQRVRFLDDLATFWGKMSCQKLV